METPSTSASKPDSPRILLPASTSPCSARTMDAALRSQINTMLLREGHVASIHSSLLYGLQADAANWPTLIQAHALAVLRAGEATTFPALVDRVLRDIMRDSSPASRNAGEKTADVPPTAEAAPGAEPAESAAASANDPLKKPSGGKTNKKKGLVATHKGVKKSGVKRLISIVVAFQRRVRRVCS